MEIERTNQRFYDSVWRRGRIRDPSASPTWRLVGELCDSTTAALEVGPGLRPRLPLDHGIFVDLSSEAVRRLRARGACALRGSVKSLPFADESFDLVLALDVVEHAPDPDLALAELARVLRDGALAVVSVPLWPECWSALDEVVGHARRYDPTALQDSLARAGLEPRRSAPFGHWPRFPTLSTYAAWGLRRFRSAAAWFEDRVFLPLACRVAPEITWQEGFAAPPNAAGLLLVCRKSEVVGPSSGPGSGTSAGSKATTPGR